MTWVVQVNTHGNYARLFSTKEKAVAYEASLPALVQEYTDVYEEAVDRDSEDLFSEFLMFDANWRAQEQCLLCGWKKFEAHVGYLDERMICDRCNDNGPGLSDLLEGS